VNFLIYIENILFVTTIRSVCKIGITGRMYLLIGERNTSQKLYMSTNTICEHNIPDILLLRSFNLNSMCSARGNVSYLFFFLRDNYTTFYGRLHVLYVSTI
jgi:hypothetical protein